MEAVAIALVLSMFAAVPDPRAANARHRLTDVLAIALLAVPSGSDDYPGIVAFGRDRAELLKGLLPLPHGVPSVSTFRRAFAAMDPAGLAAVLGRWSAELVKTCAGKQIAIDGKALRQCFEHGWARLGMLHLVAAWCVEDSLVLGQVAVDGKSNEITAVPVLLGALDLAGAVVTGDAMNTQRAIAAQVTKAGGDYVLAVKDNQPTLFDRVVRNVDDLILDRFKGVPHTAADDAEGGHDCIERRQVYATDQLDWLTDGQRAEWAGLRSVVTVQSTRTLGNGKVESFRRYFMSSLPPDAAGLGRLVRNHWPPSGGSR